MPVTPVARTTPTGKMLKNGFRTTLTMNNVPGLDLKEKEVKGFGMDGGDPIDTTTMFNDQFWTMAPRSLKKGTPVNIKAAWDPDVLTVLNSQINAEQGWTERYPNGATFAFYGFLKSYEKEPMKEGEQPILSLEIIPTFADPTTGAESAPVFTNSGTG